MSTRSASKFRTVFQLFLSDLMVIQTWSRNCVHLLRSFTHSFAITFNTLLCLLSLSHLEIVLDEINLVNNSGCYVSIFCLFHLRAAYIPDIFGQLLELDPPKIYLAHQRLPYRFQGCPFPRHFKSSTPRTLIEINHFSDALINILILVPFPSFF